MDIYISADGEVDGEMLIDMIRAASSTGQQVTVSVVPQVAMMSLSDGDGQIVHSPKAGNFLRLRITPPGPKPLLG